MTYQGSIQSRQRRDRLISIIFYQGFTDYSQLLELLSTESGYEYNPNILTFDLYKLLEEKKIRRVGEGFKLSDYSISEDGMIIFK